MQWGMQHTEANACLNADAEIGNSELAEGLSEGGRVSAGSRARNTWQELEYSWQGRLPRLKRCVDGADWPQEQGPQRG